MVVVALYGAWVRVAIGQDTGYIKRLFLFEHAYDDPLAPAYVKAAREAELQADREREAMRAAAREEEIADSLKRTADSLDQERRLQQRFTETQRKHGPLLINHLGVDSPNTAGGVDVHISYHNLRSKTIKYLEFYVSAYNAVGDPVNCAIKKSPNGVLQATGPVKISSMEAIDARDGNVSIWSNVWYNHTVTCVKLTKEAITYIDNTKLVLVKDLTRSLADHVRNDCRYTE
jgi:hypothetical protein